MLHLVKMRDVVLLLKLHPLTKKEWVDEYKQLAEQEEHIIWEDGFNVTKYQLMSDVMISDTSSTVYEFLLLGRPVITYRTIAKDIYWTDITDTSQLTDAFESVQHGNFRIPNDVPSNLEFLGFVGGEELNNLYQRSRIIVVPSKWYEGFPNVIVRGMLLERPIVTTNIGAMQSIIDDDINGRLVSPGSITELTSVISNLWPEKQRCKKLGIQGKNKALALYSRKVIYNTLMAIYDKAINNCKFQR